jgi:excisionase family DNA binding protein
MNDFLTSRQVQEILKVDRITIYRMVQDGRLKGIKIGQQWRFPYHEIERILGYNPVPKANTSTSSVPNFPTHCVQTIQDLFSEVALISSMVIDNQGNLLTRLSRPTKYYSLLTTTSSGMQASQESFQKFASNGVDGQNTFTCFAGLNYTGAPIYDKGIRAGFFLVGQFFWQPPDPREEGLRIHRLALDHNLSHEELKSAVQDIPIIDLNRHNQVEKWPYSAALAVQSILQERVSFLDRLQQIADLSNIS